MDAIESNPPASPVCEPALTGEGVEAERGEAAPASALPSQRSNNCIEEEDDEFESASNRLTPYRRKSRHRLIQVIEWMVKKHGLNEDIALKNFNL